IRAFHVTGVQTCALPIYEVRLRIADHNDPFSPPGLTYVADVESSKTLQASGQPCIVMAGSGMCEGGRILFHFNRGLSDPKNSVRSEESRVGKESVEQSKT